MSSSDNCTPCSTVSTPATRQLCSPGPANAWQETLCPFACASSTNACTSSRVKVGGLVILPSGEKVNSYAAYNFTQSVPFMSCSRTPLRASHGESTVSSIEGNGISREYPLGQNPPVVAKPRPET